MNTFLLYVIGSLWVFIIYSAGKDKGYREALEELTTGKLHLSVNLKREQIKLAELNEPNREEKE